MIYICTKIKLLKSGVDLPVMAGTRGTRIQGKKVQWNPWNTNSGEENFRSYYLPEVVCKE
jgi:hypothetical protein